jgi:amidophosphoribosyltransferase
VQMMFEAGAREVHLRVSSPPITHPDFYGIDTPRPTELLAANMSVEEMREFIGATSLAFLSVDGIYRALGHEKRDAVTPQFTDHCFTGDYPTELVDQDGPVYSGQLSFLSEVR